MLPSNLSAAFIAMLIAALAVMLTATFTTVLMLMANGTCRFERALQVSFYICFRITGSSNYNLNIPSIKYFNRTSAHATANDYVYTTIGKKIWQKPGSISRLKYKELFELKERRGLF